MALSSETTTFDGPRCEVGAVGVSKGRPEGLGRAKWGPKVPLWRSRIAKVALLRRTVCWSYGNGLETARERPHRLPDTDQIGGQSLSKRQVI